MKVQTDVYMEGEKHLDEDEDHLTEETKEERHEVHLIESEDEDHLAEQKEEESDDGAEHTPIEAESDDDDWGAAWPAPRPSMPQLPPTEDDKHDELLKTEDEEDAGLYDRFTYWAAEVEGEEEACLHGGADEAGGLEEQDGEGDADEAGAPVGEQWWQEDDQGDHEEHADAQDVAAAAAEAEEIQVLEPLMEFEQT